MRNSIVLTVTGPDRVGIVEDVTKALLGIGGNVETSRMARLGGEFAVLALVSMPAGAGVQIEEAFAPLTAEGYAIATRRTHPDVAGAHDGWLAFEIRVEGADHEGIVHQIAHGLSAQGIQIESAETMTRAAALSAAPLFAMQAAVLVPPSLDELTWRSALERAAHDANVDVRVTAL